MDYPGQDNVVPPPERGQLRHPPQRYGTSVRGLPLEVYGPADPPAELLIMSTMHGDECDGTVVLSEALRSVRPEDIRHPVVLCANPDGTMRGTRGNANGVDLNRNLPTQNWSAEPTHYRSHGQEERVIQLSPGASAGSEPETRALIQLIGRVRPRAVVTLHGPLGCVEDPEGKPLARWVAEQTKLPRVESVGYETPGSFGSWCKEQGINVVTWEFPNQPIAAILASHAPVLRRLITGQGLPEGW
jgi:protein MpaA